MTGMRELETALLDLLFELRETEIKLVVGGGYGIYLRGRHVRLNKTRTILTVAPTPRSTNDLDIILRPELLIVSAKLQPLPVALRNLGYEVITGAEKYQFAKGNLGEMGTRPIKIDLLTGPRSEFAGTSAEVDSRRVKPRPRVGVHAHHLDEALGLEEGLLSATLEGTLSSGREWKTEVYLPNPYTFLMMKLFAFRDRFEDADKSFGQYHALDMYTILSTTSESEWGLALRLRDRFQREEFSRKAREITIGYFSAQSKPGVIRLKENPNFRRDFEVGRFISILGELFITPLGGI